MTKRIFSLVLALMLCLSLLPMAAFAEEGTVVEIAPESTVEPTVEPATEPVTELESDPVAEPAASPVATPDEESAAEPSAETEATAAPESTTEADSETTPEPEAEPSAEILSVALDSAGATPPADAVAEVTSYYGDTYYPTSYPELAGHLSAYSTASVKLLRSVTGDTDHHGFTVSSPALTLDLNGCTLSTGDQISIGDNSPYGSVALTITDSSAAKAGMLEMSNQPLAVYGNAALTIQSGTVSFTSMTGISVYGTMTVSGGTVVGNASSFYNAKLTVSGGTVAGYIGCGGGEEGYGTVNITGGEVYGVCGTPGYLTISGGTIGHVWGRRLNGDSVDASDLVGFLASGYAYFQPETSESAVYNVVTEPAGGDIYNVQIKAHECEFELDSEARYTCKNGCGRSYANEPVPYLDENGVEQLCGTYTVLNDDYLTGKTSFNFTNGGNKETWFVVKENTTIDIPCNMGMNAAPRLILCDNATLTVNKGILGFDAKSLTIYAQSTGDQMGKLAVTGGAEDDYGDIDGIAVEMLTVNGGDITVNVLPLDTGDVYGIYTRGKMTVNGGRISVTTGDADRGENSIYNYGIYTGGALTVNGGTVTATAGNAKSGDDYAGSYGIYVSYYFKANGATVTAMAGTATAEDDARSCGLYVYWDIDIENTTVTATGADAKSEDGDAISNGICVYDGLTVERSTVTATAGTAEYNEYDIYVYWDLKLRSGTVQSGSDGAAVSVCADPLSVSGGTIKLRDSYLYRVSVSEGVKLADLLAAGYAYWDTEVFLALSELEMLSELNYVYVKPCTMHSADDDEVCAYCGWDPSAVAPTAKPARSPQTGDEANILLWFGLMTVSMIGVAVVVGKKKAR